MHVTKAVFSWKSIVFILLLLIGCESNTFDIDVSEVRIEQPIFRLDEAMFNVDWTNPLAANRSLQKDYKDYFRLYGSFVLNNPFPEEDPRFADYLRGFAEDSVMNALAFSIDSLFGGERFDPYSNQIEEAFRHYAYYFPYEPTPAILTYQSGFNYKVVPNDTLIGIGLEWYLGPQHPVIQRLSPQIFPNYEKEKMRADYLVVDAIKGFLKVKYQDYLVMDNVLSTLVFYGKIMVLTDALLPGFTDADKMNYLPEEWEWCKQNELQIWTLMAEEQILFENSMLEITKWVNDGPFTNGLPQDSPSRVGIWIGWQMVNQYLKKNPEITLAQLLAIDNPTEILKFYKPK
jgi:hypothetical protein